MQGRYADTLANLRAYCTANDNITAAIIIGSQVQPHGADRWSDLDLMLVARDREALAGDCAWLGLLGPVLAVSDDVTPLPWLDWDWRVRRVLYADGRDIDLSLIADEHLGQALDVNSAILGRGFQILYDAHPGRLERAIARRTISDWPPPRITMPTELRARLDDLLYHLVWAAKKLARGELWQATNVLNQHNAPILLEFAESCGDLGESASHLPSYEGRYLERRLSPDILAALDGCLTRYDAQDAARAVRCQLVAANLLAERLAAALDVALGDQIERAGVLLSEIGSEG